MKVQIIFEAELDEEELKNMISSQNDYKTLESDEYLDGIKLSSESGLMILKNPIEEYYNANEGNSQCLKNVNLVAIKKK